jgi:hypothetical protein
MIFKNPYNYYIYKDKYSLKINIHFLLFSFISNNAKMTYSYKLLLRVSCFLIILLLFIFIIHILVLLDIYYLNYT